MQSYNSVVPTDMVLMGKPGVGKRSIARALKPWDDQVAIRVVDVDFNGHTLREAKHPHEQDFDEDEDEHVTFWVVDVGYLANSNAAVQRDFSALGLDRTCVAIIVTKFDTFQRNQGEIQRLGHLRCTELFQVLHVPFVPFYKSQATEENNAILLKTLVDLM